MWLSFCFGISNCLEFITTSNSHTAREIYRAWLPSTMQNYVHWFRRLKVQPTFRDSSTGFLASEKRPQKFTLMACHYPWIVILHQYGIFLSQTSFREETSGGVAKCRLFSQAQMCFTPFGIGYQIQNQPAFIGSPILMCISFVFRHVIRPNTVYCRRIYKTHKPTRI